LFVVRILCHTVRAVSTMTRVGRSANLRHFDEESLTPYTHLVYDITQTKGNVASSVPQTRHSF